MTAATSAGSTFADPLGVIGTTGGAFASHIGNHRSGKLAEVTAVTVRPMEFS